MKITCSKALLIVLAISSFTNNLFAQQAYVSINAQYGFGMKNAYNGLIYTTTGTTDTYKKVNNSFSEGLNTGLALGYMFTKNIGAELGISYLSGNKHEYNSNDVYANPSSTYTSISSSNMLQFNPSFIITAGLKKINPYLKAGLVIGSGSILEEDNSKESISGNTQSKKTTYNGGLALGLNAGAGVLYSLNDKLSLFCQLTMTDMTYAPTKGKITEWIQNGNDILSKQSIREKQFEFVDNYTQDSNSKQPDSQPQKSLKTDFPFNSLGFSLGLKYGF
jgi:opacity protein-like surface antigen